MPGRDDLRTLITMPLICLDEEIAERGPFIYRGVEYWLGADGRVVSGVRPVKPPKVAFEEPVAPQVSRTARLDPAIST